MLQDRKTLIEQVRRLAMPLSSSDRLALIRAIASLGTSEQEEAQTHPPMAVCRLQPRWHRSHCG